MDGHELRRRVGRQQKRVHRLRNIDFAREPLHGGPFEPVPRKVQERHGHTCINMGRAGDDVRLETVLPGTREERQGVRAGQSRLECRREPMHEHSDAGPLAQGRPVVHQDTHARRIVAHQK